MRIGVFYLIKLQRGLAQTLFHSEYTHTDKVSGEIRQKKDYGLEMGEKEQLSVKIKDKTRREKKARMKKKHIFMYTAVNISTVRHVNNKR